MRRLTFVITCIFLLYTTLIPCVAERNAGSITLTANPEAIASDGKSVCIISALILDKDGVKAADGTQIRFSTSLGVIEENVETSSGVARARLTSADIPGTAIITATWMEGQAVTQIRIEIVDPSQEAKGQQYISVSADDYLAYSMEYKTLDAVGNVKIRYKSLQLESNEAQVNLDKGRIIAKGHGTTSPLKIITSDGAAEGNMFTYSMWESRGLMLSAQGGNVQSIDLSKGKPEIKPTDAIYLPEDFDFSDLSDTPILIKAKSAAVFPGEKIQFKQAKVYIDGKRVLTIPLYVLSLNGFQTESDQYIGYSTSGITLNLPLYYSLTPSSTGSVVVRHGESSGLGRYGQIPGWHVDLQQSYTTGNSSGQVVLDHITGSAWGARISHSQQFDARTNGYLLLDYPSHNEVAGSLSLSRSFDAFDVGLNMDGSLPADGDDSMTSDISIQTRAKPLGKLPIRYTLSTQTGYSTPKTYIVQNTEVVQGTEQVKETIYNTGGLSQNIRGNLYSTPIILADKLSMRYSLAMGYQWSGGTQASGLTTLASSMMDWKISKHSNLQLTYRYADRASLYTSRSGNRSLTGKHTISANLFMGDGKKWNGSVYAIRGLDYDYTSVIADFNYQLHPLWRIGVRSWMNGQRISTISGDYTSSYNDLEFSLGRTIGNKELIAVWSKSRKKIMFELGSSRF